MTKNTTMISAETENTPTMTSFPLVLLTVGSTSTLVLKVKNENRSSSKHHSVNEEKNIPHFLVKLEEEEGI